MPMLAKINIILSKCFLHYALMIISKRIWFCIVSIFDYHKKKSPPILRLHCVCGGRSYGSFIFQKHFELTLKNYFVVIKNNCFTISHQSPWLTRSLLFPSKLLVPTKFPHGKPRVMLSGYSGYSGALEISWITRRSICIWYYLFRCVFCMRTSL